MLAADDMSIFIDVTNVDLHRGVVLGSDEAASGGTWKSAYAAQDKSKSKRSWFGREGRGMLTIFGGHKDRRLFLDPRTLADGAWERYVLHCA